MGKLYLGSNPINTVIEVKENEPKTIIQTAEMPDVTITLSQNGTDIESKTTPASTGGVVEFEVSATGTYTLTATGTGITTWTRNVSVDELGTTTNCKAGNLADYSFAQWHTALQGGYFSKMFSLRDTFTYSHTGNILDSHKFFVEDIEKSGGKEIVHFRMADKYSGGNYNINPQFAWITSTTASVWTKNGRTFSGYKYSTMRQRMMKQGDEVYSQATGILPDDYTGSLTTGVKFSDLKYTNGNACSIYEYNSNVDTMTLLQSCRMSAPANIGIMMIKGYFKNVGIIDETTFNAGVYYLYDSTNYVYTKATTYDNTATYYGLYETLQEDGIFAGALANSNFASYLVKFTDYASAGGTQTTTVSSFSDYCDIPALEEITGLNRTTTLMSGISATNIGANNLTNEGSMKPSYDFSVQAIGSDYWTRSVSSANNNSFCIIYNAGYINTSGVFNNNGVRLGFRLQ